MAVEMTVLPSREAWLENRNKGIGGSEVSAVLGLNPYTDNVTLWEIKTGRRQPEDISDKPYVKYGQQAERHLRGLFRLDHPQYVVDYVDNNSYINSKYPWALASLDGLITDQDGRRGVLEIKTVNMTGPFKGSKWDGRIPDQYFCQVLFYMAVTEADFTDLVAQLKWEIDGEVFKQTRQYHIERADVQEDMKFLMQEGAKFWNHYVAKDIKPPLVLPAIL